MRATPIGTITEFRSKPTRERMNVYLEQPDGTLLKVKSVAILSGIWRQKCVKVSHHGHWRNRWAPLSHHVWERETKSRVPPGYKLYHRDGDSLNDSVDNLVMARGTPFALLCRRDLEIEQRRRLKQKAAVKRSNRRRHEELQAARKALFSPEAWYVILHGIDAVLWKPCESQRAAEKLATSDELRDWLKRDDLATPESTEVIQGRDVAVLSGHDEPLERYRRFIPDERPVKPPKLTDLIQSLFDDYRSRGRDDLPVTSFMEDSRTMTPV